MPSQPAIRAAKAIANWWRTKEGQTTEDHWARIIDRETGVADLACEAAIEYKRFTGDKELVDKLSAAMPRSVTIRDLLWLSSSWGRGVVGGPQKGHGMVLDRLA
jgi:hypothetical protein